MTKSESGILVVDDHMMIRLAIKNILNDLGYNSIFLTHDSEEALKILKQKNIE